MAALVLLLCLGVPAHADTSSSDRADQLGLAVSLGVDGRSVPAAWQPVTITLQPEAPVRGRLLLAVASPTGGTSVQRRDIEVGTGVEKRYRLLVPPGASARVQVVEDDGTVTTVEPRRDVAAGVLLGVLDADVADVPAVTLPTTDQRVQAVALDADLLDLGPNAIASLGTVVVRQADLLALDAPRRDALARHVADGAGLVVVGATSSDLGLPWQAFVTDGGGIAPAPGAWAATLADLAGGQRKAVELPPDVAGIAAGRGRLVATTADLGSPALAGAAAWEHLVHPGTASYASGQREASELPGMVEQAFGNAVGDPPPLGWLAGFFVVYVLVAGPVVGLVMARRRRPELAWVVLPLVTTVFAAAAFLGATGSRPRAGAVAEIGTWIDGLGTTLAVGGVRAPQAGEHTVVLPGTGWDVTDASWGSSTRLVEDVDTTVTMTLPGQSLGAVVAERPLDDPAPLDVEVALFDGEARVEVTNTSGGDLTDVALRVATSTHPLADVLPAGETLVETVDLPATLPRQQDPFGGFRPFGAIDQATDLGLLLRWGRLDGAPGIAWVTGVSADPSGRGVASIDGSAPGDRGTLLAVGVTPPPTDDTTVAFEVQRDVVSTSQNLWADSPMILSGQGPVVLRFQLPAEGRVTGLDLSLDRGCCGGGLGVPVPVPPAACGTLEVRDADGDLVSASDTCDPDFPCPPDAIVCEWSDDGSGIRRGRACDADDVCQDLVFTPDGTVEAPDPAPDPGDASGLQVWNHGDRRWVELAEAAPAGTITDPAGWVGPLGDVWVRVVGDLSPFEVAPQTVTATLGGDA